MVYLYIYIYAPIYRCLMSIKNICARSTAVSVVDF